MTNGLLICPDCQEQGKTQTLGSIDANGYLHVRRYKFEGGTTVIYSKEFMVICNCGFGTIVFSRGNGHTIAYKQNNPYTLE